MTGPQPPEPPLSPEFRVPATSPQQPGALDDPQARRKRMRLGIIGAAAGFAIPLIIIAYAVAQAIADKTSGSEAGFNSGMFVLLAATVLLSPVEIVVGIILAAIKNTRPFGVGFLIGAGAGAIIMAGVCFSIPAVTN
jgi:hypothetical protein